MDLLLVQGERALVRSFVRTSDGVYVAEKKQSFSGCDKKTAGGRTPRLSKEAMRNDSKITSQQRHGTAITSAGEWRRPSNSGSLTLRASQFIRIARNSHMTISYSRNATSKLLW